MTELILIAAISQNYVIGNKGRIPWKIPEDLKHFRELTTGKMVVMGRKTYEGIGRALPDRKNIVVTRGALQHESIFVAHSIEEALVTSASLLVRQQQTPLFHLPSTD